MTTENRKKTVCPVSRNQFEAVAKDMAVKLGEQPFTAQPRQFSTGSMGWYANGKISIPMTVLGKTVLVACQVGLNITVIGSKELPPAAEDTTAPAVQATVEAPAAVTA